MSPTVRAAAILLVCVVVAGVVQILRLGRPPPTGTIPNTAQFTPPDPELVRGTKLLTLPGRRITSLDYYHPVGLLIVSRNENDDPPDSRLQIYKEGEDGFSLDRELSLAGRAYVARFIHQGKDALVAAHRYPIADPNASGEQAKPQLDDVLLLLVKLASGATTLLSQRTGRFSLSPDRKRIALVSGFDTNMKLRWPSQLLVAPIGDLADRGWNCVNVPLAPADFLLRAPRWSTSGERLLFDVDTSPDPLLMSVTSAAAARDVFGRLPWETIKRRILGKTKERAVLEGLIAGAQGMQDQATAEAQYEASLRIAAPLRFSDATREILESAANIDSVAEDLEELLHEAEADPDATDPPMEYVVSKPLHAPHHPMFSRAAFTPIALDDASNELLYFADVKPAFLASNVAGIYAMTLEDGASKLVFAYPEKGIEAPTLSRFHLHASRDLRLITMVMYERDTRGKVETERVQVFDRVAKRLFTLDLSLDMYAQLGILWLSEHEVLVADAGTLWKYHIPHAD